MTRYKHMMPESLPVGVDDKVYASDARVLTC